jgi:uncharacterized protein YjbI with pentapeptide repeats
VKPHKRSAPAAAAGIERVAEQEAAQAETARDGGTTPPPAIEGNPEHLAKLREGVEAWNKWRKKNPDIKPNLCGADFRGEPELQPTLLGGMTFSRDDSGTLSPIIPIDLSNAGLSYSNFNGMNVENANLSGAILCTAKFIGSRLDNANLSGADLTGTDLHDARLWHANLSGTILKGADLTGAHLCNTNLSDACVDSVIYDRALLHNHCSGVRAETCYGNAQFKRDVMDQDYLDQIEGRLREGTRGNAIPTLFNGFQQWRKLAAGAVAGILLAWLLFHGARVHHTFGINTWIAMHQGSLAAAIVLGSVALAGFFAGTLGKLTIFKLWGLFDFGRSWTRVLVFAVLVILVIGLGYCCGDGFHVALSGEARSYPIWFFPWFVAAMGFATLGISSYATPLDSIGALLMIANVLSGFLTLGLLLSVLGNIFARRA